VCFCFICDTKAEECVNWANYCTHISTKTHSQRKKKENLMKVNNPFHDCSPCVFLKALCRNNLPERKNPDDLNCQLYGYQKQALRFIVDVETCDIADERVGICTENHYRRGILAVSTGLGKTAIMIAAIIDEQERNKKYY
jgi:SNF2 family DNA or RNA helicase